jgi:glycosyltransferase involved in cell wall biosynthesis
VIGISLLTLVPRISGGSETYVRALVRELARVGELEYRVFLPSIAPDAGDGLESVVARSYRASRTMPGRIAAMSLAAAFPSRIKRELEIERLEAIHFPLSVMLPPLRRPPAVTSVLDIQHEVFPHFFSRAELAYRKLVYGWTVKRSRIVITISEHERGILVERLGLAPEKIRVIYLAVDHEVFKPGEEKREPFLLYPANNWPHKNHTRLFEAFSLLRRERPELRLVLTGSGHERRRLPEGVQALGHVPLAELASLYRRACCLVFPSLYEGFGQPPLEALASGCPVAVSRVASLPEVCGNAACYFDPTKAEEIAAAVTEALDHPAELREKGIEQARAFTWERCAREHEQVYRELISESSSPR